MAVIGLIAILVELALILPKALRLNRQLGTLVEALDRARVAIESDLAAVGVSHAEVQVLWKPYKRVMRWLSHPLTVALLASYRRRRSRDALGG